MIFFFPNFFITKVVSVMNNLPTDMLGIIFQFTDNKTLSKVNKKYSELERKKNAVLYDIRWYPTVVRDHYQDANFYNTLVERMDLRHHQDSITVAGNIRNVDPDDDWGNRRTFDDLMPPIEDNPYITQELRRRCDLEDLEYYSERYGLSDSDTESED